MASKMSNLQSRLKENDIQHKSDLERLTEQLTQLQDSGATELRTAHQNVATLKARVSELEKVNQGHLSEIEKDRALF